MITDDLFQLIIWLDPFSKLDADVGAVTVIGTGTVIEAEDGEKGF